MQKLPKYLTREDIKTLLKVLEDGYNVKRNKAIVWMLYTTGMRVSELVNLNKEDIVQAGQIIETFVVSGKGEKERMVYLPEDTRKCLKDYLGMTIKDKGPLFTHSDNKRLSRRGIWKFIREAGRKAEFKFDIGAHTLRHSYAVHLLKEGMPIRYIQDLLGHESLDTTMIYTKLTNKDLLDKLKLICF